MTQPSWTDLLAKQFLKQYRRDRFWRNIRFLIIVGLVLTVFFYNSLRNVGAEMGFAEQPYVSYIRMSGEIMPGSRFSAMKVIPELARAFADPHSKGVVLDINSPGGSPVQASEIHDKILSLKKQYPNKKVVVVAEDSLASGAYLVAVAADEIYVNPSTVTGSIGVVMRGFGFDKALQKVGVSRRVFTSGNEKSQLDAFEPLRAHDVQKMRHILAQVHRVFISDVVAGRGARLHGNPKTLFSGDFWTGEEAVSLGLADGTKNLWQVLASDYHVKKIRDYTQYRSLIGNAVQDISSDLSLSFQEEVQPHLVAALGN